MPTITIYLPKKIHAKYKADKNRKGVVAKFLANRYGMSINEDRVVMKEPS